MQSWLVKYLSLAVCCAGLMAWPSIASTQEADAGFIEEVIVTGTRSTIRSSIEEKRASDTVVEALSVDDIGDIPALSIGEALETLTSAASHREQGGATEISIRGMGPYLGSTTVNGREATNGSGDRSVNFSQFPSELFNKIMIYKTQEASLIEGGVSGQIALDTINPLDYGKRRIQVEVKGNYNPDNSDINDNERDWGARPTLSYIDQFETDGLGDIGVSLGIQKNLATNPEQEARTTSGWRDCRADPSVAGGVYRTSSGNCDSGSGNLNLNVDPATGVSADASAPFIFVPSSRSYRQNITDDERESFFAALQWRPNQRVDINFDMQVSDRTFTETRNDLVFAEQRRIIPGLTDVSLIADSSGAVSLFETIGRIETNSTWMERIEEYRGGGLNLRFQVNDTLSVSLDASYSDTMRRENIIQTRLQSEPRDIHGNTTPAGSDRVFTSFRMPGSGADVFLATVENFDVTNADLFADSARSRIDLNQARDNTIEAVRGDVEWDLDWNAITSIEGGVRYSKLEYESWPRVRDQRTFSDDAIAGASLACRNSEFPESGFLSEARNGNPLITNVDENGNVISQGTGSGYASFDPLCLVREFVGGEVPPIPEPELDVRNIDVEEETLAAYIQANYRGELAGKPVRGNFGLRVVNTETNSTGLRTTFTTETDADGVISVNEENENFFSVSDGGSYTELLPSFSLVMDLREDLLLRGGIFRGLSRPDPADLGFGRALSVDDSGEPTSIAELVGSATAYGEPSLEPLTSWNFDVALEWYPNDDTILALGAYYKEFLGGFENVQRVETFTINGQPFTANVTTSQTDSGESTLYGFELTAAHSFSWLPGAWSGLGAKLSLNLAESDFEFEDGNFGSAQVEDDSGNVVTERVGIVPPADIFGFSDTVASAQLYYQIASLDFQVIYKYRSEYFQQFISTPGNLRYIGDTEVFEARVTYQLNDWISIKIEGINLFDEPRSQYNPTPQNFAELNSYGPRLFASVRAKF
ncbi:MAG: TonB-dependent receptor [Halieaceae bacterium]|nr:TonB-dependent receptor [Halieaceae bacterium]